MDDVILVRCGRDVPLESFISLLEDDSATFSEGRCERKDSNSKSELNTASYETESAELWILADNGQLLKVADINRVVQIEDLKLTKESRRCHMSCELSDNGTVSAEGQVLQLATCSATKCVVQTEYVAEIS